MDEIDCTSIALNILRNRVADVKSKDEQYDEIYGRPYNDEYEAMLYDITGLEVNQNMFKWGDFK